MDPKRRGKTQPDDAHEALLSDLRRLALRVEPAPVPLILTARETLTWRRIDAELAELLSDSILDDAGLELVRSEGGQRSLSFEATNLTIDLEIIGIGARKTMIGQLVPPSTAVVEVHANAFNVTATADELGRFRVEGIPSGQVRLRLSDHPSTTRPVETSWIGI